MNNCSSFPPQKILFGAQVPSLKDHAILNGSLRSLLMLADSKFDLGEPDSFENLHKSFYELCNSECIKSIIQHELLASAKNSLHRIRGGGISKILLIAESEKIQLLCRISHKKDIEDFSAFQTLPSNVFFGNVGTSKIRFKSFACPEGWKSNIFKKDLEFKKIDDSILCPGEVFYVNAEKMTLIDNSDDTTLHLILTSKAYLPLTWIFDKTSFLSMMSCSSHEKHSRMQIAALSLSKILIEGEQDEIITASEALAKTVRHSSHFVRWSALQALCVINRQWGLKLLSLAKFDPHPHIQNAATKAIEKFDKMLLEKK